MNSDDRVHLKIPETGLEINDSRPLLNTCAVLDASTFIRLVETPLPHFMTRSEVREECPSTIFIGINVEVNSFMADSMFSDLGEVSADLLRTPLLFGEQRVNLRSKAGGLAMRARRSRYICMVLGRERSGRLPGSYHRA